MYNNDIRYSSWQGSDGKRLLTVAVKQNRTKKKQ
jgi:hypothetical protein